MHNMLPLQSNNFPVNEFAYHPINTHLGNGCSPPFHHVQLQLVPYDMPIQIVYDQQPFIQPMLPLVLNTIPFTHPVQQSQIQYIPSPSPPCFIHQGVQMERLSPPRMAFVRTPSPSTPRHIDQRVTQERLSQPRMACESYKSMSAGGAGTETSDAEPVLREFYRLDITKQKASSGEIQSRFEQGLVRAMLNTLQLQDLQFLIHIISSKTKSTCTIQWILNEEKCDYANLELSTMRPDFQKKLICELAKIGDGRFNKYLSGAKQLAIINGGWLCLDLLKDVLISKNGTLRRLLAVRQEDRFEEEAFTDLYKVSADEQGKALRGPTVVGVRFKQQSDIMKMPKFIEEVKNSMKIKAATMIASLKTQRQYKGWSVYLDVDTVENVRRVEEISQKCGFEKARAFVAEDNYQSE